MFIEPIDMSNGKIRREATTGYQKELERYEPHQFFQFFAILIKMTLRPIPGIPLKKGKIRCTVEKLSGGGISPVKFLEQNFHLQTSDI